MNLSPQSSLKSSLTSLAALALLLAATATQADVTVTNVTVAQQPGEKRMEITYDVASTVPGTVTVSLAVTNSAATVNATSLTGAVGPGVATGTGKKIFWDAGADWNGNVASLNFTLTADDGVTVVPDGFALIPAGSFQMGDSVDGIDVPVHTVQVSAFYMARNLVTWADWGTVRTWGLTHGYTDLAVGAGKAANHPVQTIIWYDMVKWCNARSEKENLTPCYTVSGAVYKTTNNDAVVCNWAVNGYRLPTEAEWEKAARGGVSGKRYPWGDTITHSLANYQSSSSYSYDVSPTRGYHPTYAVNGTPYTSPVGSFAPNDYGLYDMAGNVWEWCWDWYGTYAAGPQTDPRGVSSSSSLSRVVRGGDWYDYGGACYCRVAFRVSNRPTNSFSHFGFRVARSSVP